MITSHHDVLEKKILWKQKKIRVRFSIGDPPAKPAKQKKTSSYWKIIEVTHSQRFGRGRRRGVIIILLELFSSNSWSCQQTYLGAGCRRKSPLDGATDFLATICTLKQSVLSKLSFWFWPGSPKMPLSVSELGLKHTSVYFKSLCGCLPLDNWSCVQPVYAGKRL